MSTLKKTFNAIKGYFLKTYGISYLQNNLVNHPIINLIKTKLEKLGLKTYCNF